MTSSLIKTPARASIREWLHRARHPRTELERGVLSLYRGASFASRIDFTQPAGDPGILGPEAVGWRVMRNPATVFMGGISAVLLEFLLPGVRAGVWDHSYFKQDPVARMQRTGLAAMVSIYGSTEQARWVGERATRMHRKVNGISADGVAYDAQDPQLQKWVAVTASYGFLQAYRRYINPRLSRAELDQYWADGQQVGQLYGDFTLPRSAAEVRDYMAEMRSQCSSSAAPAEFLALMRDTPARARITLPVQRMLIDASIDLLPTWSREMLDLEQGQARRRAQRPLVKGVVMASDWLLRDGPAFEACRRVGVSPRILYT